MKDTGGARKPEQNWEQDWGRGRERPERGKSGGIHRSAKIDRTSFMAALAQGVVPRVQGQELLDSLSQMGNYAFLQALERRGKEEQGWLKYAERERIPAENLHTRLNDVTEDVHPQEGVNTIAVMPQVSHLLNGSVPEDWLTNDNGAVSALAPIPFEQVSFSSLGIQRDLGGSGEGSDGTGEQ